MLKTDELKSVHLHESTKMDEFSSNIRAPVENVIKSHVACKISEPANQNAHMRTLACCRGAKFDKLSPFLLRSYRS